MKKYYYIILLLVSSSSFAQKERNIWYFGYNAGLDFNSGMPVALTDGMTQTQEGCASICDSNGSLLFYTDGVMVWDKYHNQMPNGDSLNGQWSSTQSAIIVPFVGNKFKYYIFTAGQENEINPCLSYSIVDITQNFGHGDIIQKNIILKSHVTERLTAVKHANGNDVWIMVHDFNNNFYSFLVTSAGVNITPVISNIGSIAFIDGVGYMKYSPDGSKIAFISVIGRYIDLFDFNSASGLVTNEKYLPVPSTYFCVYGLEFSNNSKYLYSCSGDYDGCIYQWDISSNDVILINSTRQQIECSSGNYPHGALQLGPDAKIYVADYSKSHLSIINNPDLPGSLCNLIDSALTLNGKICRLGLPNYIQGMIDTNEKPIEIDTTAEIKENIIFLPNIFSPNSDGNNDILYLRGENISQMELQVYDRWGNMVFGTQDKNEGWTGRYKNKDCQAGVYFYVANITFYNGEWRFRANWAGNSAANWSTHSALNWSVYSAANWAA